MIEALLNRLRGTGVIKHFGTFKGVHIKLVWNHIYALYLALVLGIVFQDLLVSLGVFIMYLIGEAKGWGKWVGALTNDTKYTEEYLQWCYTDKEGQSFPYIHQISNFIIPEQAKYVLTSDDSLKERITQYLRYCTLALTLRGFYWWACVYLPLVLLGYISLLEYLCVSIGLGLAFPLACYLGKLIKYKGSFGVLHLSPGWENQELVYGLFQGIALWYLVLQHI